MLAERIIALSTLASKDATRYHLGGVWLFSSGGKLRLCVTDGTMCSIEQVDVDGLELPDSKWLVENDTIPMIKALVKKWGKHNPVPVSYDQGRIVLGEGELYLKPALELKPPPFDSIWVEHKANDTQIAVVGEEVPVTHSIAFNPDLLALIYKALQENKKSACRITFKGPHQPITVRVGTRTAILMPMR